MLEKHMAYGKCLTWMAKLATLPLRQVEQAFSAQGELGLGRVT
jgi:hypothetical protein